MKPLYDIAIIDLNNDGKNDIILNGSNGILAYLQRTQEQEFDSVRLPINLEQNARGMVVDDVTGDQLADIIVTRSSNIPSANLLLYTQNPDNTFNPAINIPSYEVPHNPVSVDMDNDGLRDIVVLNGGYSAMTIHYQNPEGGLDRAVIVGIGEVQLNFERNHDIGDVTGDGLADLVHVDRNIGLKLVTFGAIPTCPTTAPPTTQAPEFLYSTLNGEELCEVLANDIDNDGYQEFIVLSCDICNETVIKVARQQSDGSFAFDQDIPTDLEMLGATGLAIGDVNSDNRSDIAIADYQIGNIALGLQDQNGIFSFSWIPVADHPASVHIADWNGDSKNDVAVLADDGFYILSQQANGTLNSPVRHLYGQVGGNHFSDTISKMADWNSDGLMDLIGYWDGHSNTTHRSKNLRIFLQKANGNFEMLPSTSFLPPPADLEIGDINNDGRLDILLSADRNRPIASIGIFLQQADGTLGNRILVGSPLYERPRSLLITDLNGDQLNDILVRNSWHYFSVFTQNSMHTLDQPVAYTSYSSHRFAPQSIAQIDENQDGIPEAIGIAQDNHLLLLKPIIGNATKRASMFWESRSQIHQSISQEYIANAGSK
jgi:hypothetical protein